MGYSNDDGNLVTVPEYAVYDFTDPFQYGWQTLNCFALFWGFVRVAEFVIARTTYLGIGETYKGLAIDKQKNVITYIMQILVTSIALAGQIRGCYRVLFLFEDDVTNEELKWISLAHQITLILYLWEMIYRQSIGTPLLVHHVMSIFFFQAGFATTHGNRNVAFVRMAVAMGMFATTEQLSFVALFLFRLDLFPKWQAFMFKVAAVQTFIFKTAITVFVIPNFIYEGYVTNGLDNVSKEWVLFWRIFYVPLLFVLYGAQLFAVKILYSLAVRCQNEIDGNKNEDGGTDEVDRNERQDDIEAGDTFGKETNGTSSATAADGFSDETRTATVHDNGGKRQHMKRRSSRRKSDVLLSQYENSDSVVLNDNV